MSKAASMKAPLSNPDVGRASLPCPPAPSINAIVFRAEWQQPCFLDLYHEPGSPSPRHNRAKVVVPFDPVAPAGAGARVVPKPVGYAITERAGSISRYNCQAQAQLDHNTEKPWDNMKPESFTGRSMQPRACPWLLQQVEVGSSGFAALPGRQELRDHSAVECLQQLALSCVRRHRDRQVVRGHDILVMGSD